MSLADTIRAAIASGTPIQTAVDSALAGNTAAQSEGAQAASGMSGLSSLNSASSPSASSGSGSGQSSIVSPTFLKTWATLTQDGKSPVQVEMQNGHGYINGKPVTEAYPGVVWNSTGDVQQPGGDYGYYTVANSNTIIDPTKDTTQKTDPFQGLWSDFMKNYVPQYITQPTTTTADLSTYTKTIQDQLAPILETQVANLAAQRKQAKKDAETDLAKRGFFGQLPSAEKMDQVNSTYDNSEANLRANYLSTVLDKAFPLYSQSLSQDAATKTAYNQNMLSLGLAVMNGMIDQNKFIADEAYRKAALAKLTASDVTSLFGTVGGTQ
jgi:hypothetical protein